MFDRRTIHRQLKHRYLDKSALQVWKAMQTQAAARGENRLTLTSDNADTVCLLATRASRGHGWRRAWPGVPEG